ncbi:MAG: DNA adenine methylase [Planctomycetota bacterium]|jgi:DNA adenine methylase
MDEHVEQKELMLFDDLSQPLYINKSGPKAPIAWYGGKWYYADWIISHFPHHRVYIEPFGGSASVLFRKHPSEVEVYNDLDGRIVNFFQVLRDKQRFEELLRLSTLTPYSRKEFTALANKSEPIDTVEKAWWFFVRCRQAIGGLGMSKLSPASWAVSLRTRRKMAEPVSKYLSAIDGLQDVAERLRTVLIENLPASELLSKYDAEDVLFYCDPPYLPETRHGKKAATYGVEMTYDEHVEMLTVLNDCKGRIILSGYASDLYDSKLSNWRREEASGKAHLANSGQKRTEVIWLNW